MSNKEIVQHLYSYFKHRDFEKIRSLFDGQIEWNQMKGFPGGGQYIGADEIFKNVFGGFKENWIDWQTQIDQYIEAGDVVIVLGKYTGTFKQTNRYTDAAFAHFYFLRNGKIVRFDQYTDTLLIGEAMGKLNRLAHE